MVAREEIRALLPDWVEWQSAARTADSQSTDEELDASPRARDELKSFLLGSLQMQNVVVLAGSGTSMDANGPSMKSLWDRSVDAASADADEVMALVHYGKEAGETNIEELLSRCDAYRRFNKSEAVEGFRQTAIGTILELCRRAGECEDQLEAHKTFLRRLARRRVRDPRLKLFTTNYDRCFDLAAGSLGLVVVDGFSFSVPRYFDPRYFSYDIVNRQADDLDSAAFVPGVFQYFKLHGSVDWSLAGTRISIDPEVDPNDVALIYPAATKFQSSYQQPHLELMAQYLSSLRQPNTCLLVVGFGFNDEHLSEPILAAIDSNPHLRVLIVTPEAEERTQDGQDHPIWRRMRSSRDRGGDVALIAAYFADFAEFLPNLKVLSPADRLSQAVADVVRHASGAPRSSFPAASSGESSSWAFSAR